ncbi:unnamed protein product [Arctogadus glacialis]
MQTSLCHEVETLPRHKVETSLQHEAEMSLHEVETSLRNGVEVNIHVHNAVGGCELGTLGDLMSKFKSADLRESL